MITGKIVALDTAASTGFAIGFPNDVPAFGVHVFEPTGVRFGRHQRNARNWFSALIEFEEPAFVIYEAPSLFGITTPATVRKLCSYGTTLEEVCTEDFGVAVMEANPAALKKFWTGRGNALKDDMVAVAERCGFKVRGNDDAADALAIWHYAVFSYGPPEAKERVAAMLAKAQAGLTFAPKKPRKPKAAKSPRASKARKRPATLFDDGVPQ